MNLRPSGYEPDELPLLHPAPPNWTDATTMAHPQGIHKGQSATPTPMQLKKEGRERLPPLSLYYVPEEGGTARRGGGLHKGRSTDTDTHRERSCLLRESVRPMSGLSMYSLFDKGLRKDRTGGKRSAISTAWLHPLLGFHLRPIKQVVFLRPYSVWQIGGLILGRVSHLDAFSASHFRSWLPGNAPGGTTGTPAERPTRSSRTKVSSPQTSSARAG